MICARTKFIHEVSGDNRKTWKRVGRKYIDLWGMRRVVYLLTTVICPSTKVVLAMHMTDRMTYNRVGRKYIHLWEMCRVWR